jgi:rhodanese-related sulfurtransferase
MSKMSQLFAGFFLLISTLFSCQQPKADFKSLSVADFDSFIKADDVQRLDVRTLAEYSEGHIPGAVNINVLDDSFAAMADSTLQKERPVALYCRSGKRSKKAAEILSKRGYKVYELDKGFNAWQQAGKAIEQ